MKLREIVGHAEQNVASGNATAGAIPRDHLDFNFPVIGDAEKATYIFNQNLVSITWNVLRVFESTPCTCLKLELF